MTRRAAKSARKFRVGTIVTIVFGGREVKATIVEDRGNVGWNGRHIVRIAIDLDATERFEYEVAGWAQTSPPLPSCSSRDWRAKSISGSSGLFVR
jgi:hypothetical protein